MTPLWIVIPIAPLIGASAALLVFWSVAIYRIARELRALPTARAGLALARVRPPTNPVCVVVPAHNEQNSIGALVRSFRAQDHPDAHFVLCLDRCTDDTERVAREAIDGDPRFTVVLNDRCPEDWAGKVHAVWRGVTASEHAARARHLLFTDADCEFHPSCLSATIALAEHRDLDMLSLFSTQRTRRWYERIVQPSTTTELVRQYPLVRANLRDSAKRRAFANGQFMLFRADAYHAIGGHETVKDALLEDIAFARVLKYRDRPAGLLLADGMVTCAMYDTWAQYRRGWKRIFTESANRKAARLRTSAWRLVALCAGLPVAAAACAVAGLLAVPPGDTPLRALSVALPLLALAVWAIAQGVLHVAGRSPVWAVPLSPVGAWLTAAILREAARDLDAGTATEWGGRTYQRDRR